MGIVLHFSILQLHVFVIRFHWVSGKGDLVGCDISQHLVCCSSGQGSSNQHGTTSSQDCIVKSSSDVKVVYNIGSF